MRSAPLLIKRMATPKRSAILFHWTAEKIANWKHAHALGWLVVIGHVVTGKELLVCIIT